MKKNNILVSVLIINYNNAKYIKRAIKSCLKQNYKNIEILIFDDLSNDNSKKEILKYRYNKKIKIFFNKGKKKNIPAFDAANGYFYLYKKSKGKIICLLDSDDYFKTNKIDKIVQAFYKKNHIEFIQNLPIEKNKVKKENKNNFLSFWPYLAPESCISFKRVLMTEFIKKNHNYKFKFEKVWFGFRLGLFSYFIKKNFFTLEEHLTIYEIHGESKNYKSLNKNWFIRRSESFEYLYKISKKISHKLNFDYILTSIINFLFKI